MSAKDIEYTMVASDGAILMNDEDLRKNHENFLKSYRHIFLIDPNLHNNMIASVPSVVDYAGIMLTHPQITPRDARISCKFRKSCFE